MRCYPCCNEGDTEAVSSILQTTGPAQGVISDLCGGNVCQQCLSSPASARPSPIPGSGVSLILPDTAAVTKTGFYSRDCFILWSCSSAMQLACSSHNNLCFQRCLTATSNHNKSHSIKDFLYLIALLLHCLFSFCQDYLLV